MTTYAKGALLLLPALGTAVWFAVEAWPQGAIFELVVVAWGLGV